MDPDQQKLLFSLQKSNMKQNTNPLAHSNLKDYWALYDMNKTIGSSLYDYMIGTKLWALYDWKKSMGSA